MYFAPGLFPEIFYEHIMNTEVFLEFRVAGVVPSTSEGLVACDLWTNGQGLAVQDSIDVEGREMNPKITRLPHFWRAMIISNPCLTNSAQNISRNSETNIKDVSSISLQLTQYKIIQIVRIPSNKIGIQILTVTPL